MAGPDEAPLFAEGEGDTFYDRQLKLLSLKTEKKRTQPFWRVEDPILDEYRRVLVGGMWDYQRKVWLAPNFIKVLVGGYGCIVGDQEVYDPVAGVRRTVSDLGELNTVSLDTSTERLRVNESLAVPKGVKDCVHVSLDDGSSIKLTTDHPLYTSRGWIKAGELLMTDLVATPSYLPDGKFQPSEEEFNRVVLEVLTGLRLPPHWYGITADVAKSFLSYISDDVAFITYQNPGLVADIRHLCLVSKSSYEIYNEAIAVLGVGDLAPTSDIRWVRIGSITPIGKHEVFDLSVDNDHNFVCNNVVVHNSGKTNLGSKRIIALALENAPIPVATVSPTFSIARRTVVPQISEFLLAKQNQFGSAFDWRYNSGVHEFKIRFEGRNALIQVLSGENPLSLRGPNLAAAFMDEPFIQDWAVFEQLVARIRHPDAVRKELLLAGTPDLVVSDWGQDLCAGNLKGFKDIAVVRASTRGNKSLGPEYVERLEGMLSEKAAKVYLDGYFLNLSEGLVYYGFDTEDHVVDLAIPQGAELGAGMDFNVNPMSMCVFWVRDGHMHIMDEFELPNADTEYACQVLVERYWNMGLRTVYPDATGRNRSTKAPGGKSDFHFIRDAGFSIACRQENPQRKDRYNSVNSKFKSKLGKISLTVSPKCKNLIKYLTLYSHENLNKQEHMSHLLDSMGYPCAYLFPVDRETLSVRTIIGV